MVYVAKATGLFENPFAIEIALIVSVLLTEIGLVYLVDLVVGVIPLVV
jgi:hypothetical protein